METKQKKFPVGRLILSVILAIFVIAGNIAVNYFSGYLDNMFTKYEVDEEDENKISYEDAISHGENVTAEILREGSVLLKNEEKILPLSEETQKVNVFGWRSSKMVFGGAGSGFVDDSKAVSLQDALKNSGIETNEELLKFYQNFSSSETTSGVGETDFSITEVPVENYSEELIQNAKNFSDVALVVFSRMGGEGNDLPKSMEEFNGDAEHHYLELSADEESMLQMVENEFSNVIVLINSSHAMELGFLNDANIDAALWIGCPGTAGLNGVVDVLTGKANPSGRLVDTYAYDLTKAPSYENFGDFSYVNAPEYFYTNYMEGIYVGYRYYETRGFTDGEEWYQSEVQYPFGYGLSYTDFAQSIEDYSVENGVISMDVKVENTGDRAGKDVVQLYYTPPYYEGGIEKSYVVLAAFGKTNMINPGESETLHLSFSVEDMASYDEKTDKAYVLDPGIYEIRLMKNAHELLDSRTLEVTEKVVYNETNPRSTDLTFATNQFDDANVRFLDDKTYLSRSDWNGTWPSADYAETELSDEDLAYMNSSFSAGYDVSKNKDTEEYTNKEIATDYQLTEDDISFVQDELKKVIQDDETLQQLDDVETNSVRESDYTKLQRYYKELLDGRIVFGLMKWFDYKSPVWDLFLNQMSVKDYSELVSMGGYRTAPIESIDKSVTMDIDGPAGMQPFLDFDIDIKPGVGFPTEVTTASTWNVDLAKEMGICVGEFANTQNVYGWYAPAMNGHRSPFAGRNFEYYSEDGFLSGKLAAATVVGARSQGIWVYIKHFALNEQELHRDENGILTFANEQSIREVYLKPFEIAVKDGDATGVMSSFNRIGTVWSGASRALCTNVLRNEWGFQGAVITDFYMNFGTTYMNALQGVLAGNDLYLNPFQAEAVSEKEIKQNPQLAQATRNAVKNILYMTSRVDATSFHVVSSWRPLWVIGNVVGFVIMVISVLWLVLGIRKNNK